MNYQIIATQNYLKRLEKFLKKHPKIAPQYQKTIAILCVNPNYPALRMHKLQGRLQEYYSISINLKYRIVVDFIVQNEQIILIDIGTHNEVYK
ncbi:MAG: type II toxin-antitoxin system mRNA interferase toxin, RelE/StbE family [Candidatus Thioglobus sp.]|nr:type II toxin-antitoxin system mRNA interferase toxin, RelE/StbE family [Candidatus Thioglobus sp.]